MLMNDDDSNVYQPLPGSTTSRTLKYRHDSSEGQIPRSTQSKMRQHGHQLSEAFLVVKPISHHRFSYNKKATASMEALIDKQSGHSMLDEDGLSTLNSGYAAKESTRQPITGSSQRQANPRMSTNS